MKREKLATLAFAVLLTSFSSLAANAIADESTRLGESLIDAVRTGDADTVRQLLASGADPNAANDMGWTALHCAARGHHLEIMRALVAGGADVNRQDQFGRTPLLEVAAVEVFQRKDAKETSAMKFLLQAGAKPDGRSVAAAAWAGSREAVDLLLEAGANPVDGLVGAASRGDLELVKLLLAKGATVDQKAYSGNTALHAAAGSTENLETAQFLLQQGADVNARNELGKTPLHGAAYDGNLAVVRFLIGAGAAANIPDNEGATPLRLAAIEGKIDVYNVLLEANGGTETVAPGFLQEGSRPTAELVADLASRDAAIRQAAQTSLVARGEKAMPAVLAAIKAGESIEKFAELFIKMGPAAADALPELEARLDDPKLAFRMITIMNQMKPGHFESLPRGRRDAAAAAIYRFVSEPQQDPMIPGMVLEMFPHLVGEASEPYFLKLLRSNSSWHRANAAESLSGSTFATEQLRAELINVFLNDTDMKVRQEAARALGNPLFHSPRSEAELLRLAMSTPVADRTATDERTREAIGNRNRLATVAAHSLMTSAPKSATESATKIIDNLLPFLSPINAPQRSPAMDRIKILGAPAIPRLIELLDHEDEDVAISASVALNRMGRMGVPALVAAIREGDEQVIERAASAFWWIGRGATEALPALVEIAGSEEKSDVSRMAAVRAALKIDPEARINGKILSAIPALIRVLRDGSFKHQGQAAEALGHIGPAAREALPVLQERREPPPANFNTGGLVRDYVSRAAKSAISAIEAVERENRP
jgi:ankyrin repeat protein/HEAT repeat protein